MSEKGENIKLTDKQKLFVDYYVGEARQNATKAAKFAGYSEKTAYSIGSENLRKPEISEQIEMRLKELTLSATAVLTRLTQIANADVDDFLNEAGQFDLKKARRNGKTPLLKKLKQKRTLKQKKTEIRDDMRTFLAEDETDDLETDVEILFEETEFELHSSHEALRDLGKHYKLFTDKTELTGADGKPIEFNHSHKVTESILKNYGNDESTNRD